MKKLLAILLTLVMLCGISAFAEDVQGFTAEDFEGEWHCANAYIEIYWEEEGYKVLVHWSGYPAASTEWEYSCYYDEETNTIVSLPFGTRTEYLYNEKGEVSAYTQMYDDGEATFALTDDGQLIWMDEKEDVGKDLLFEKMSDECDTPMFETIAQAFEEGEGSERSGATSDYHIAVVKKDGQYIRIIAQKDETAQQLEEAIFTSDDWEAARAAYLEYAKTLPVVFTEIITDIPMTQEELDLLTGKTFGELEEEGFEQTSSGENGFEIEIMMNYGLYEYRFIANEPSERYYELMENDAGCSSLTVKSASLYDLSGRAFDLDYNADGSYNSSVTQDALGEGLDFLQSIYDAVTNGEFDLNVFTDVLKDATPEQAEQIQAIIDMISSMSEGTPDVSAASAE